MKLQSRYTFAFLNHTHTIRSTTSLETFAGLISFSEISLPIRLDFLKRLAGRLGDKPPHDEHVGNAHRREEEERTR